MPIGWADGATDKEMGMAWCKKARVTRAVWEQWTPYHAQNSARAVWELYR